MGARRGLVGQLSQGAPRDPAMRPQCTEPELVTCPPQRPARVERPVEQVQQCCRGGRIDTALDPAT